MRVAGEHRAQTTRQSDELRGNRERQGGPRVERGRDAVDVPARAREICEICDCKRRVGCDLARTRGDVGGAVPRCGEAPLRAAEE